MKTKPFLFGLEDGLSQFCWVSSRKKHHIKRDKSEYSNRLAEAAEWRDAQILFCSQALESSKARNSSMASSIILLSFHFLICTMGVVTVWERIQTEHVECTGPVHHELCVTTALSGGKGGLHQAESQDRKETESQSKGSCEHSAQDQGARE